MHWDFRSRNKQWDFGSKSEQDKNIPGKNEITEGKFVHSIHIVGLEYEVRIWVFQTWKPEPPPPPEPRKTSVAADGSVVIWKTHNSYNADFVKIQSSKNKGEKEEEEGKK